MHWQPDPKFPEERGKVFTQLQTLVGEGRAALLRLGTATRALVRNRTETRRFLASDVYRVPEPWLDDVVRVRLDDLGGQADDEDPGNPGVPAPEREER